MPPGQRVVSVAFQGVRPVGRQRSGVGRTGVGEIVERLVKGTGSIGRVASGNATVGLIGSGQAGVVATQPAVGVAEHSAPIVAETLGEAKFYAVIAADRLRIRRTRSTCAERVRGI